jgi:hypothetical protein
MKAQQVIVANMQIRDRNAGGLHADEGRVVLSWVSPRGSRF